MRVVTLAFWLGMAACGSEITSVPPPPPPNAASVSVSPGTVSIPVSTTFPLTATVKDAAGQTIPNAVVTWSSDDNNVATVSTSGMVTAVAVGSAQITAASGSASGTAQVTVITVQPASVSVSPTSASVPVAGTTALTAVVKDAAGHAIPNAAVTWTTGSSAIATVANDGTVTGVGVGTTQITATSGTASGSAQITVTPASNGSPLSLVFSSYAGGRDDDQGRDVTVDAQGNVYITGSTASNNFPVTSGALDPSYNAGGAPLQDAFVTKLSPSGAVVWSTYVGGPNYERAYGIELDPQGAIVIAGRAGAGLPTTAGSFQPNFGGGIVGAPYGLQDGFVCKIAPNGGAIQWCSYLGVADQGFIRDVAVDANGDVFVAAQTQLGGFPASWFTGSFQPTKHGGNDALIVKIKGDGTRVLWATYLGGSNDEAAAPSIRVDAQGNAVVAFSTNSPDMPTANAQFQYKGANDFYVAKISADGRNLLWGSYFGGSGNEALETHGVWIAPNGDVVFVTGSTSSDAPTTPGAYQAQHGGGIDIYVGRLSANGNLLAATYVGGSGDDGPQGIAIDGQGNVYIGGWSDGPFPTTGSSPVGGGADAIAIELSPDLKTLLYGGRFGGNGDDYVRGLFADLAGDLFAVGETSSSNFPTKTPFQASYGGGSKDAFAMKLIQ